MPPTIPSGEPTDVIIGDTWQWTRGQSDYPVAEGWLLSYGIAGATTLAWKASYVTNDGVATHTVLIPASATAELDPGTYRWAAYVSAASGLYAGQRYQVDSGVFRVQANLSMAVDGDAQPWAERALVAIEAAISGSLTTNMAEFQIAGRAVKRYALPDLLRLRAQLKAELLRARFKGQLPGYEVAFVRAS